MAWNNHSKPSDIPVRSRQIEIRSHYGIEAKNYGFYVCRNKRLIS